MSFSESITVAGAEGPAYKLFGYFPAAELTDSGAPSFTVTGLQQGNLYYFELTSYDTSGNESGFSESVCALVGDTGAPLFPPQQTARPANRKIRVAAEQVAS